MMESMGALVQRSRTLEADIKQHGADQARCAMARTLIQDVAEAGAGVAKLDDRLLLRGIMDYWTSVLRISVGANPALSGAQEEVIVSPPLLTYSGPASEMEDGLTRISMEEFLRLVDRREFVTARRVSKATLPAKTNVKMSAVDSQFYDCMLIGVRLIDGSRLINTSFVKCRMNDFIARSVQFVECRFATTQLGGADFRDSDFTRTLITDCQFDDRTFFLQCNFTYAKLLEARGSEVTFSLSNMTAVELSNAQLPKCKFDHVQMVGAKLLRSNFQGSDFSHASLRDVDVDGASFAYCDLEDANFEGARNIERANFEGSTWHGAKFDPFVAEALEARYSNVAATQSDTTDKIKQFKTGTGE